MYTYKDLIEAYRNVGVESGRVVYITGNFGRPGHYEVSGKKNLLNAHFMALTELLGHDGTLVVPTHSWSICNTDIPFDSNRTPSETGPFTEYVRTKPGVVRQYHPFSSSTAYGREALALCGDTSRHVYGLHSPFQRMIDRDALYISVGQKMEMSISIVHHIEFMMGVPYRYTKEFLHPCVMESGIANELFYLFVVYQDCDAKRDFNNKIMGHYRKYHEVSKEKLGGSFIESFSMKDFYESVSDLFRKDIYAWLSEMPTKRPYRL